MSKKQTDRMNSLMPNGVPKYIRIYDNEESADRYTVVFTGNYNQVGVKKGQIHTKYYMYVGMSASPYHPQGFCLHMETEHIIDAGKGGFAPKVGGKNHLGKRITFESLPEDCKKVVFSDYQDLWEL